MAPIRAIKTAAPAPLPTWDQWRDMHQTVVENYDELASAPWEQVRSIELFPGSRLDADAFVIPEAWMPAGTLRYLSSRTFSPAVAGVPDDPAQAKRRDECVRRALYALYLPGNTRMGIRENKPATFRSRARTFLRFAAWQFEHRPSKDGSIFGDLSLADVVTGFYSKRKSVDLYKTMFLKLWDAGRRGVISDYPRFFADEAELGVGPVHEDMLRGAPVLERQGAAPESQTEPFPDEFVTAFVERALWLQENLADGLIAQMKHDMKVREDLANRCVSSEMSMIARRKELEKAVWLDASGEPLTHLRYPVLQFTGEGRKTCLSTEWPPRHPSTVPLLLTVLQGCNLGLVNLCTGARSSELLAADDVPFGPRSGRYQSVTFKLVEEIGGRPRDWPLHPFAERAIDKQRELSRLYRPKGENQLWIALQGGSDGRRLAQATSVFIRTVEYLGLSHLLGNGTAHMHRWRHTVARLVALSVVGAPKVLFDLFGHKSLDMTLHYMLSSPEIADEAMRVAKETTYAMVENAIVETLDAETSGPAAPMLRDNLPKAMRRSEDVYDTKTLRETAEVLTFDGSYWSIVREGVICTKGLGQYGPCTKGRGTPDPGACRTSCDHRLELAIAERQCEETLAALIRERSGAAADGLEMLVANLDGQIVAELKRWDGVRERVLAAHPDIRSVWESSSK